MNRYMTRTLLAACMLALPLAGCGGGSGSGGGGESTAQQPSTPAPVEGEQQGDDGDGHTNEEAGIGDNPDGDQSGGGSGGSGGDDHGGASGEDDDPFDLYDPIVDPPFPPPMDEEPGSGSFDDHANPPPQGESNIAAVPEPVTTTLVILGAGGLVLAGTRRHR